MSSSSAVYRRLPRTWVRLLGLWRDAQGFGLFARTFLLLAVLMTASLAAWIQGFRTLEQEPRAVQIAQQVVTVVNITRAALIHSAPNVRRDLLLDLVTNEGIQIYPREADDLTEPIPHTALLQRVKQEVIARLGPETELYWAVNRIPGLWVSFSIFDDQYWIVVGRDRAERVPGVEWLGWGAAALVLSLTGAAVIVGFVNRPLSRLARAAQSLARAETPPPLPETGPEEIRSVNASFNRMVEELNRSETDRAVMLAGISHDLRTPLTRLRLELELSDLPEETRQAIEEDISQIDRTVAQFMDYARPPSSNTDVLDVSDVLRVLGEREIAHTEAKGGRLTLSLEPGLKARIAREDLERIISNLLENARRYGRHEGEALSLQLKLESRASNLLIIVDDAGPGIAPEQLPRLVRPFTRGSEARSDTGGAGLGLAIVQRLVQRAGGQLEFSSSPAGGLRVTVTLQRQKLAGNAEA
jgi:two-component system osmolarity sensor histidine kinase EnvZ